MKAHLDLHERFYLAHYDEWKLPEKLSLIALINKSKSVQWGKWNLSSVHRLHIYAFFLQQIKAYIDRKMSP